MPRPILCFYYLTYRCNARCVFCAIYQRDPSFADPELVAAHLKQMKTLYVRYIDFTGGEPLLHPKLPQLLEKAHQLGFHTTVTTNCLLYPKQAEELRGLVDFLHFSLDSADRVQHDEMRGVPCFDKVMESIEVAMSLGEHPDILMTVTRDNFNQIEPLRQIAERYKLMLVLNPVFDYLHQSPPDRELAEKLLNLPREKFLYNNTAFLKLMLKGGNNPDHPRCKALSASIIISPEGKLLLPCFHRYAVELDLTTGLAEVRRSAPFRRALEMQGRYPFCRHCAINCYFDPSFLYQADELLFRSLIAKLRYVIDKYFTV